MKPDSWSSRPAEFVQFKLSRGQTVIIKGLVSNTIKPLSNLWAFRASENVCESNQYMLIVQADLNLLVECDTTFYSPTVYTKETFKGEWNTHKFLQNDDFPIKSLSIINRTFNNDMTAWNVLEDGEARTAPYKPDWYEMTINEQGYPEYKKKSVHPDAETVTFGYNHRLSWPNKTNIYSVLF